MLYAILHIILKPLFRVLFNLTIIGQENIPESGGFIAAPNHRSWLDIPVVGRVLPRRMYSLAKKELYDKKSLARWLYSVLGAIPIDRYSVDIKALRKAIEVLKSGHPLLAFPEGTRSEDAVLGEGKKGVVYLASVANVPIVPMGLVGVEKAMPKHATMFKPSHVVVVIGKPFYPSKVFNPKDKDFLARSTEYLMREIALCIEKANELL
ncbi:MAG: lysophospholipid acyltransferase family protein [Caldisericaceae bacterium]